MNNKVTYVAMMAIMGLLTYTVIATTTATPAFAQKPSEQTTPKTTWMYFYAPVEQKIQVYENMTSVPESHHGFRGMDVHGYIAYVHLKALKGDVWNDRQVLYVLEQIDNPYANIWLDDGFLSR